MVVSFIVAVKHFLFIYLSEYITILEFIVLVSDDSSRFVLVLANRLLK